MRNKPKAPFEFTVAPQAIRDGDWASRDANPLALVIASKLPPDTVVYVDLRQEEYYVRRGTFSEWYNLPDDMAYQITSARDAITQGQDVAPINFTLWLPGRLFQ